jgi:multiple sugar transport system substrate-binding protein
MTKKRKNRSSSIGRRQFLTGAGIVGVSALAGCSGDGGSGDGESGDSSGDGSSNGESQGGSTGNAQENTIVLNYWRYFGGGDGFAMEELVKEFNNQHDNIQINEQQNPVEGYIDKLYAAASGGNMPDIVAMFGGYGRVMQPLTEPLDPYISDETRNAYFDVTWEKSEIDGEHRFLPIDFHGRVLYFNRDILSQVGADQPPAKDWKGFVDLCNTIQSETDAQPFAIDPTGRTVNTVTLFYMHYRQQGNEPFMEDGASTVAFDNEQAYEVARTWQDIHNGQYSWDPLPVDTSGARLDKFRRGELAMMIGGNWDVNALKSEEGEFIDLDFGITKPLQFPGDGENVTWGESNSIYLAKKPDRSDEKTQAAVEAMEWITQNQTIWGTHAGHLPAAKSIATSNEVQNSDLWSTGPLSEMADIAENGEFSYFPQVPVPYKQPSLWSWTQDIYAGNLEPEAGVKQGANKVQQAINDAQ